MDVLLGALAVLFVIEIVGEYLRIRSSVGVVVVLVLSVAAAVIQESGDNLADRLIVALAIAGVAHSVRLLVRLVRAVGDWVETDEVLRLQRRGR